MKYMGIKEFVDEGYLQEANRRFFHPLGLALEAYMEEGILRVWDCRDDEEGVIYDKGVIDADKHDHVVAEFAKRDIARFRAFGFVTQPVEE